MDQTRSWATHCIRVHRHFSDGVFVFRNSKMRAPTPPLKWRCRAKTRWHPNSPPALDARVHAHKDTPSKHMPKRAVAEFRRAGTSNSGQPAPSPEQPFAQRRYGRVALVAMTTVAMTLA